MTTPAPTPVTTARTQPAIRRTLTVLAVWSVVASVVLVAIGVFVPQVRLIGLVAVLASVAYAGYVALYVSRGLIEFGGGRYRVREAFTDVRFAAPDVRLVVPVDELALFMQGGPALVVLGTNGRTLAEVNADSFGRSTLEALVSDLIAHGAPLEHVTGRVTPAEFARRYPGALSWPARHMIALNVVISVALLVVAVVSVVIA